jgi:hypothetical protein
VPQDYGNMGWQDFRTILDLSRQRLPQPNAMHWIRIGRTSDAKIHQMSVLLAAIVQVGLFWIPFARFHFASSIHLCNCFFVTTPNRKQQYIMLRCHLNLNCIEAIQRNALHHTFTPGAHESDAHENRDLRSNASRTWGEKGRDRIGYRPCS